jgi:hypothetical protein
MTLAERSMTRPTTMGLDISRADFLKALDAASLMCPEKGASILVFERSTRD